MQSKCVYYNKYFCKYKINNNEVSPLFSDCDMQIVLFIA